MAASWRGGGCRLVSAAACSRCDPAAAADATGGSALDAIACCKAAAGATWAAAASCRAGGSRPRLRAAATAENGGSCGPAGCKGAVAPPAGAGAGGAASSAGEKVSATAARLSNASAASAASQGIGLAPRRQLSSGEDVQVRHRQHNRKQAIAWHTQEIHDGKHWAACDRSSMAGLQANADGPCTSSRQARSRIKVWMMVALRDSSACVASSICWSVGGGASGFVSSMPCTTRVAAHVHLLLHAVIPVQGTASSAVRVPC